MGIDPPTNLAQPNLIVQCAFAFRLPYRSRKNRIRCQSPHRTYIAYVNQTHHIYVYICSFVRHPGKNPAIYYKYSTRRAASATPILIYSSPPKRHLYAKIWHILITLCTANIYICIYSIEWRLSAATGLSAVALGRLVGWKREQDLNAWWHGETTTMSAAAPTRRKGAYRPGGSLVLWASSNMRDLV